RGTPVTVRLVKGAYWDRETIRAQQHDWPQPVYNDKAATDANFERLTRLLLEHHEYLYAAIGSHNVRSQALACAIAETLNIPPRRVEMQVLYGMGDKLAKALAKRGHRVRVYCPYGELLPGMSYLIRRLLENTANSSFLRQNLENRPIEELIAPPQLDPQKPEFAPQSLPFANAPDSDYAQGEIRDRAWQTVSQLRQQLGQSYQPWINGEFVSTQATAQSLNPSNPDEVVGTVGLISIEQADEAVATAKAAFSAWRQTPVAERAGILRKAAELMEQRRHELNAWMVLEVGKPLRECDGEVSEAIDFCRYYASEMERLQEETAYDIPGETNRYHYQPRGISLIISPWNFPLAIPTGMTVASLVAGNCTLLKPAEVSSVIAAKLAQILIEAGIPKGVFQFIPGKGSTVGAHLVKHPDVQMITFTGSQEVGCQIYRDAALLQPGQKHLKRVIAEMGGKNGIIIDESADLDQAVAGVVQSAFGYSGQKCSACSRVIVLESVYETFVERLTEAVRSLNVGDASKPGTQVGPVIDAKAQQRIREYIAQGKQEGTVAVELASPEPGYFVGPVVITEVAPDATIAQEEIFGPVLAVLKVANFDEALTVANGTDYALTGGIYSRTPSHIDRAMAEFEVGNLYVNRGITGAIVSRQPFGGFKLSGVGSKAGGPDYLLQFLEPRTITENIQRHGFAPIEGAE
ncbi:L-glutamate gamma-semialdehyde dehydrogenase, partial [Geitlerinema sp. P-1104]|uniref:L-glutamate gamma-semialdehyde dehydrogenase n=1 Tax=Geitlerinema sp. P-1104 TaxID=2546230 RepID=UPI00147766D3